MPSKFCISPKQISDHAPGKLAFVSSVALLLCRWVYRLFYIDLDVSAEHLSVSALSHSAVYNRRCCCHFPITMTSDVIYLHHTTWPILLYPSGFARGVT